MNWRCKIVKNKKIIGIYLIKNKINGKCYIGQSRNIKARLNCHKSLFSKTCVALFNALNKYGPENFEFLILEECTIEDLNARECYWIERFNTMVPDGYNLTSGGGQGIVFSEETRKKISKALTGENNPMYGKIFSEEKLKNLSEKMMGIKIIIMGEHFQNSTGQDYPVPIKDKE